jgi:hypothetical protein
MKEYTLVNRFTEKFRIGGHRRVRSKKVRSLKEKRFMLKKKRECKREEEEGNCEGV